MYKFLSKMIALIMILSVAVIPETAMANVGTPVSDKTVDMYDGKTMWKKIYTQEFTSSNMVANNLSSDWCGPTVQWTSFTDGNLVTLDSANNKTNIVNPRGGSGIQKLNYDSPYNGNHLTFYGKTLVNYAMTFDMQIASCFGSSNEKMVINFKDATEKAKNTTNYYAPMLDTAKSQICGSTTTLADDSGTKYRIDSTIVNTDTAEGEGKVFAVDKTTGNKYLVSTTVDGTTTYYNRKINFKIVVDGGIETIWWKWEGSDKWQVNSCRELIANRATYIAFHSSNIMPVITNFDVYQRASEIVKIPEKVTLDSFVAADSEEMIASPHFGTPEFTEPGRIFTAEVRTKQSELSKSGWMAYLENEYKSWNCEVTAEDYAADAVYMGTKPGYRLKIKVPADISPELMNLVIIHEDSDENQNLKFISPQSVSVVPNLDEDFYAVGISDTHLNAWKKENGTASEGRNIETMNKALEIAGARYLYHGGDIGGGGVDKLNTVKNYFVDAFTTSKMPLIVVAGNHDYDKYSYPSGTLIKDNSREEIEFDEITDSTDLSNKQVVSNFTFDAFDRMFGKRSALITMGDSMVIAKHDYGAYRSYTGENSEPIKLRDALAQEWKSWNGGADGFRVLYQHTYNTGSVKNDITNTPDQIYGSAAFMSPTYHNDASLPEYDFQAIGHDHATYAINDKLLTFGGSGHGDCDWSGESVIFSYSYDASSAKKWALDTNELMRNDRYKDGKYKYYTSDTVSQMTSEELAKRDEYIDSYYQNDFIGDGTMEEPALYASYYNKNNGTAEFNVATVTNTLDFNFYDGRIKFVMKRGEYELGDGAQMLSQYDSADGLSTIVLAKVNIPAATADKAVISVSCSPKDETSGAVYNLDGAESGFVAYDTKALNLVRVSGAHEALSDDNVKVLCDGQDTRYSITKLNARSYAVNFDDGMVENTRYSVSVGEQKFEFVVLPKEYIADSYYGNTGVLTYGDKPLSFANNPLENFVMEFTLRSASTGREKRTVDTNDGGRMNLHFCPTVNGKKYDYYFYNSSVAKGTSGWNLYAGSTPSGSSIGDGAIGASTRGNAEVGALIDHNSVSALELEENYDFRIIKAGKELSVWVKKTTDTTYDRIFEYHGVGAVSGREYLYLPEEAGYVYVQLNVSGVSNNTAKGLKLYDIADYVEYNEKQGTYMNIKYGIQPDGDVNAYSAETDDGTVALPVTKNGIKDYTVDLSALNRTISGSDVKIKVPGYTNVYGINVKEKEITVKAADEMASITDEKCTLVDGKYNVSATITSNFKNTTGTMNAIAICATYTDENALSDVKTRNITAGANKVVFDPIKPGERCVIYVFETLNGILPLTASKTVKITNNQ